MIHHVYANQSNAGDWLSARGIQSLLSPLEIREHWCDEPFVPATVAALAEAGPGDLILIGGGGLLMDYFLPFWKAFLPISSRAPFVFWGVGCCQSKRRASEAPHELLVEIVRRSQLCVVRDELTRNWLGLPDLPAPVPCPTVVAVRPCECPRNALLHVDHLELVGEEVYERMVTIAQAHARAKGRVYRQTNNRIRPRDAAALAKTLELYHCAEELVSSRLHGCIIALALGRPVLAVSGDHKIESFMEAAGLGEWVLDLEEIDEVPERLRALPSQPSASAFIQRAREDNLGVSAWVRQWLGTTTPEKGAA